MDGNPVNQRVSRRMPLGNLVPEFPRAVAQSYGNGSERWFLVLCEKWSNKKRIRHLESKWNSCFKKTDLASFYNVIFRWEIWI